MIKQLRFHRFKRWSKTEIDLSPTGISLVVGGNNSGKSSLLHGLALWEFCRTVYEQEKGKAALSPGSKAQGLGLSFDEFTPVPVASLKHLWTNLKPHRIHEHDGYTLKVSCAWDDPSNGTDHELEFGLSLANDRLFIRPTLTTVDTATHIPRLAYLPPFAGISEREKLETPAIRRRLIGQGLAGAVLRNILRDAHSNNVEKRNKYKVGRRKIKNSDLAFLRETDPWELLQATVREVFQQELSIRPFNPEYHTHITIETYRGEFDGTRFKKLSGYNKRDLMVEGSGFLQWLSVYALALNDGIDVLLLDEPDAHLHCTLQTQLMTKLAHLARQAGKQVLIASHSTELLKLAAPESILEVAQGRACYLTAESQKVGLLAGLGVEFSPRIFALQRTRRMLIVEGSSDEMLLKTWTRTAGYKWPENLVVWHWNGGHRERRQLFLQLRQQIPDLKALSIRDRDDEGEASVGESLEDRTHADKGDGFYARKWRRRHIENYLLWPQAIASAANTSLADVEQLLARHMLVIDERFVESEVPSSLANVDAKKLLAEGATSVQAIFGCDRFDIAEHLEAEFLPTDVESFVEELIDFCAEGSAET